MQGLGIFNDTTLRQSRQSGASPDVVSAVRKASASTGVDFSYLMEKASVESGFNPNAKASTSSATGLYQFTDSTWLGIVAKHGTEHGLGAAAASITVAADGTASVADPTQRQKILDLRTDPTVAATMAAELARDNKSQLESSVGGEIGGTELYLAHFLGAGGAAKFIDAYRQNPNQSAAAIMPNAAASNPAVFTDSTTGKPCTLAQVYDHFASHFGGSTFLAGANPSNCNVAPTADTSNSQAWSQNLADRAVPGVGGPTLSLYAILALASLGTPGKDGQGTDQEKNNMTQIGKLMLGL